MRRSLEFLFATAAFGLVPIAAQGQVWEKFLMPGLTYRMEIDPTGPRLIHILRYSPGAPGLSMVPEVSGHKIFGLPENQGREELSAIVKRAGAIGGVNADFFPFTADPLGAMVRDGELISRPDPRRAVVGWGTGGSTVGKLNWKASITMGDGPEMPLSGLNEECPDNGVVVFTDAAAQAISKPPCTYAVLQLLDGKWTPTTVRDGNITSISEDVASVEVPATGAVIVARGTAATKLKAAQLGGKIHISMTTGGLDFGKFQQVIGGGPFLLNKGKQIIDSEAQGFGSKFAQNRHPRTAVGITEHGEVLLAVVDGRSPISVGCSLLELSDLMIRMGCTDAINLDGGGSSTFDLFGLTLNRPSDGAERKISNALLLMGPALQASTGEFSIQGAKTVDAASPAVLKVVDSKGTVIKNSEVLWAAQGQAWIDQGGTLRGINAGEVTVSALVKGQVIRVKIAVTGPPLPDSTGAGEDKG
ncbi:MAG: phosphodiester glycosidase family protein [Armatimonadetes bacterium]|nr:phosphodiester glycosidase family protein [Armatimonadota bacterium]